MKLVLINYEYPPLGGGAANATAELARALVRKGHTACVLSNGLAELAGSERDEDGVRVIRLRARRRRIDRSNFAEMASFVFAAARALPSLARNADGLIVFFALPCGPLGWYAHHRTGVPFVISLRGGDVPGTDARASALHRWLAPLRRAALRQATAVVANSRGLADLSERVDSVSAHVVANGVDTVFFSPLDNRSDSGHPFTLLFAGRFQPQKNLFVLLDQFADACARVRARLHLVLVGDGPQRAQLEKHARARGIDAAIQWRGWLSKPMLREAYQGADVFLNPSHYEGMPNTVLEAMACGLPVIASKIPGHVELVAHGETGLLFDLADPDGLAATIIEMADCATRRATMGANARRIVCEHYSWDMAAMRYARFFSTE